MTTQTVDTLILGGGTAGAVIAGRLAQRGDQSILLVEAGPDYGALRAGRWSPDLLDGRVVATQSHDWAYTSAATTGMANHPLERARVIGGCSAHNGCVAIWGSRADYDGWAAAANPGWSTAELLPIFQQANEMLRVRRFAPSEVTPFHAACLAAIQQSGLPLVDNLNDLDADIGVSTAPMNIYNGVRWNSAFAYLDPVRDRPQLTIRGDTLVNRLHVVNEHVVAVELSGPQGSETISPGRVILCAGAYGSPAILLRSGIGAADELQPLGIQPVLDRPGVGRNLHDHPAIYLQFSGADFLDAAMNDFAASRRTIFTEQSLAKLRSDLCTTAFDLHLYPCSSPTPNAGGHWEFVLPIANMTPLSRGSVRLRDGNPATVPQIDTAYLSDTQDRDVAVLWSGVQIVREIASQRSFVTALGQELASTAQIGDQEAVRRNCLHYYHPVGTCKMGPATDSLAVVDAQGKVHGLDNLYVADASIMPVIPRANTNLPTVVLAERVATWL